MRRGRLMKYRAGKLIPWTRPPYGYRVDPDHPRDPGLLQVGRSRIRHVTQMFSCISNPKLRYTRLQKRLTISLYLPK